MAGACDRHASKVVARCGPGEHFNIFQLYSEFACQQHSRFGRFSLAAFALVVLFLKVWLLKDVAMGAIISMGLIGEAK